MNKHNRMQRRLSFCLVHSVMGRAFAETGSVAFAKNVGIALIDILKSEHPDHEAAYMRARSEGYSQQRGSRE